MLHLTSSARNENITPTSWLLTRTSGSTIQAFHVIEPDVDVMHTHMYAYGLQGLGGLYAYAYVRTGLTIRLGWAIPRCMHTYVRIPICFL